MKIKVGQKINFGIPYFESKLKYEGEVVGFKNSNIVVTYQTSINLIPYQKQTEIPFSFIINTLS